MDNQNTNKTDLCDIVVSVLILVLMDNQNTTKSVQNRETKES